MFIRLFYHDYENLYGKGGARFLSRSKEYFTMIMRTFMGRGRQGFCVDLNNILP